MMVSTCINLAQFKMRPFCLLSRLCQLSIKPRNIGRALGVITSCPPYGISQQTSLFGYQRCQYIRSLHNHRPKLLNESRWFNKPHESRLVSPEKRRVALRIAQNLSDSSSDKKSSGSKDKTIKGNNNNLDSSLEESKKLSIFQRFKVMWKKYWYVLIPVHLVTSTVWFGCCYYASVCGFDIVAVIKYIGFGDFIVDLLKKYPSGGHMVVAYALYKIATPARYAVTLSGSYYAIKHLSRLGYIKPAPSKEQVTKYLKETRRLNKERFLKFKQKQFGKKPPSKNGR